MVLIESDFATLLESQNPAVVRFAHLSYGAGRFTRDEPCHGRLVLQRIQLPHALFQLRKGAKDASIENDQHGRRTVCKTSNTVCLTSRSWPLKALITRLLGRKSCVTSDLANSPNISNPIIGPKRSFGRVSNFLVARAHVRTQLLAFTDSSQKRRRACFFQGHVSASLCKLGHFE